MAPKTDVVVKLVLVFFISLLSFSIGTFIGKKYSDNQHQLSQLEPQKNQKSERTVASTQEEGTEKKSGAMSDEEIAKLAEEFVADDTKPANEASNKAEGEHTSEQVAEHAPQHGAEHAASHTSAVAETKGEAHSGAAEHKPAHEEKAAANVKHETVGAAPHGEARVQESRIPTSLPKDVAHFAVGKFTVQIASFADESEAQKTASDLKEKGYSAFYVPANIKGKTWYRVSVGQFATVKEATTYRADLISKAKVNSAIVQKITE